MTKIRSRLVPSKTKSAKERSKVWLPEPFISRMETPSAPPLTMKFSSRCSNQDGSSARERALSLLKSTWQCTDVVVTSTVVVASTKDMASMIQMAHSTMTLTGYTIKMNIDSETPTVRGIGIHINTITN